MSDGFIEPPADEIAELNQRLIERTQGFLDRAAQDKRNIDALREALKQILVTPGSTEDLRRIAFKAL